MSSVTKKLHWTAVVGSGCSFWLLFWLFCIAAALYDLDQFRTTFVNSTMTTDDQSGLGTFMVIVGAFVLWSGYRAIKRLSLMKYGRFLQVKIVVDIEDSYNPESGITGKATKVFYQYSVNNRKYSKSLFTTRFLKDQNKIAIVHHAHKPGSSMPLSRIRARFDQAVNEWNASMWHVIPRLTLLILIAVSILVLLSR